MPLTMSFLIPSFFSIAKNDATISKPIKEKLFKSVFVMCTAPFKTGSCISVDGYSGTVQSMNLFYVKLKNYRRTIYMPTSNLYDKVIEETD